MPRVRRTRRTRASEATTEQVAALAHSDFFGVFDSEDAMRELWGDPDVKAQVAAYLEERRRRGHTRTRSWAEERFGK